MVTTHRAGHKFGYFELVSIGGGLLVDHDFLFDSSHGQDASLRRVDDSCEGLDSKHAQVGDSKGSGFKIAEREFLVFGFFGKLLDRLADADKPLGISIWDQRGEKPVIRVDSNIDSNRVVPLVKSEKRVGLRKSYREDGRTKPLTFE